MTAKNDVTGDFIKSKPVSKTYEENFDSIFRKEKPVQDNGSSNDAGFDPQRNTPLVGGMGFRRVATATALVELLEEAESVLRRAGCDITADKIADSVCRKDFI